MVAAESAFQTDLPEHKVMEFVSNAIDGVVGFYNAIGVFRHSSIYVLRHLKGLMPAVLLEIGFLTNSGDATDIKQRQWMDCAARALAAAMAMI